MSGTLRVSVIICSRNRPDFLGDAVESVLRGSVLPQEIVVVDQSDLRHEGLATMGTRDGCSIRYLWQQQRGVSRARNAGLAAARGEILAYTDDDVLVDGGWLRALAGALETMGPEGVTTGRVLATTADMPGGFAPALVVTETPAEYRGRVPRDVLEAGNMAVYRETLQRVGGFDPRLGPGTRFPAGEDNDMGLRLLAAGCRIRYVPEAVIHHRAWRGPDEYLPLRWRYGVGQGAFYAKHLSLRDGYMLGRLGRLLRHHLGLALRRARKEPRPAVGHLAYVAGVLSGAVRWRMRARRSA